MGSVTQVGRKATLKQTSQYRLFIVLKGKKFEHWGKGYQDTVSCMSAHDGEEAWRCRLQCLNLPNHQRLNSPQSWQYGDSLIQSEQHSSPQESHARGDAEQWQLHAAQCGSFAHEAHV